MGRTPHAVRVLGVAACVTVVASCGDHEPDLSGLGQLNNICIPVPVPFVALPGTLQPCGYDECGEYHDNCDLGFTCDGAYCVCEDGCGDHECGTNGCGESCPLGSFLGECIEGQCIDGYCIVKGDACEDDGECFDDQECRDGMCEHVSGAHDAGAAAMDAEPCRRSCDGLECGADGCGGRCGTCGGGLACRRGQCVPAEDVHCNPCTDDVECGSSAFVCAPIAEPGLSFCARHCDGSTPCPAGYKCAGALCVPSDRTCQPPLDGGPADAGHPLDAGLDAGSGAPLDASVPDGRAQDARTADGG